MGLLLLILTLHYCMRRRYSDLTQQEKDDIFLHGIERFQSGEDPFDMIHTSVIYYFCEYLAGNKMPLETLDPDGQWEIVSRLNSMGLM